ncbi:MAG: sigma 54-interacting transcriptional regulator [Acidobacteria bacterium]|nr:sigma 54-interacting transcriptional regulator [Acidobacteriota bacterium]
MKARAIDIAESFARVRAENTGPRDTSLRIAETLCRSAEAIYAFVAKYDEAVSGDVSILGASGLDAAAFRRLEQRAAASALMRVFDLDEVIYLLVHDEPTLDFLSTDNKRVELIVAPFKVSDGRAGFVAAAFDKQKLADRSEAAALTRLAALAVAEAIRVDGLQRHSADLESEDAEKELEDMKARYDISKIVGNSNAMRQVAAQVRQIARSNTTVLLRGERGTGKEMLAYAIHLASLRSRRPFRVVNCAGMPEALLEAELFGVASPQERPGMIGEAKYGTLFIDEIAETPPAIQDRIFRLMRDSRFENVNGTEPVRANLRLIFSTAADLEHLVAAGEFSEELFYRLNAFTIFVPPLRDRKADILLLSEHFIEKYSRENRRRVARISTAAIDMLAKYHFPGNVRELENVIERAVMVCDEGVIHARHLPATLQTAEETNTQTKATLEGAVAAFERDIIEDALKTSRGNIAKAARGLGTTERILGYKIKNAAIDPRRYK